MDHTLSSQFPRNRQAYHDVWALEAAIDLIAIVFKIYFSGLWILIAASHRSQYVFNAKSNAL